MIRQKLKSTAIGMNNEFRYRGEEQTRIETFSDAVFALAVTLLVLSSTIPSTFTELKASFHDTIPFAICITLLMLIWYQHYIFFIRYGFRDVKIVAINTLLLFLILIYIYPLKFLFKILYSLYFNMITGDREAQNYLFSEIIKPEEISTLMILYGLGAAGVFLILSWMYRIALKRKKALNLSKLEIFHTKTAIYDNLIMAVIPLISVIIAASQIGGYTGNFALSGFIYWLYAIAMPLFNFLRTRKKKKLFSEAEKTTEP